MGTTKMDELDDHTHTEFSGPVGYEKKIHKTHWTVGDPPVLSDTQFDTGYEWVLVGMRWKLKPKETLYCGA